jgi:hypothetical protein
VGYQRLLSGTIGQAQRARGVRPSAAAAQGPLASLGGEACELRARKPSLPAPMPPIFGPHHLDPKRTTVHHQLIRSTPNSEQQQLSRVRKPQLSFRAPWS